MLVRSSGSEVLMMRAEARGMAADTKIDPGEQKLQVSVSMSFELQ